MRKQIIPEKNMTAKTIKIALLIAMASVSILGTSQTADAGLFRRQYYTSYSYHPTTRYHYCRYYYTPTASSRSHRYHYVIYFPSRPRYRYYYNPVRRLYWGRFEVDSNGDAFGYSMLRKEDRKTSLDEIPESAFPEATAMPPIPESQDGEAMLAPPTDTPSDLPEK